jgi:hypothetical protein
MQSEKCSICCATFSDNDGGARGFIGILPVSFCPVCLNGVLDMAEQLLEREKVWSDQEGEVHQPA